VSDPSGYQGKELRGMAHDAGPIEAPTSTW
jgi:hypothetical protein